MDLNSIERDVESLFAGVGPDVTIDEIADKIVTPVAFESNRLAIEGGKLGANIGEIFPDSMRLTMRWRQRPMLRENGNVYYRVAVEQVPGG